MSEGTCWICISNTSDPESRMDAFTNTNLAHESVKFSFHKVRGVTVEETHNDAFTVFTYIVRNELNDEIGRVVFRQGYVYNGISHL